jgi:hypothetical protein
VVSATAATAKRPRIRGDVQPYLFDSISAYVRAKSPMPELSNPGRSRRCSFEVSFDSLITSRATTIAITPTGTLMKKIQLQLICSVITPPRRGPIARAIAETPAQMPIAMPRWRGGKVKVMIESVAGFIIAEPTPWTTRAPIRKPALDASPHASEDAVKMTSPRMNRRLRPKRSASLPPVSMNTANVSA